MLLLQMSSKQPREAISSYQYKEGRIIVPFTFVIRGKFIGICHLCSNVYFGNSLKLNVLTQFVLVVQALFTRLEQFSN